MKNNTLRSTSRFLLLAIASVALYQANAYADFNRNQQGNLDGSTMYASQQNATQPVNAQTYGDGVGYNKPYPQPVQQEYVAQPAVVYDDGYQDGCYEGRRRSRVGGGLLGGAVGGAVIGGAFGGPAGAAIGAGVGAGTGAAIGAGVDRRHERREDRRYYRDGRYYSE